MNHCQVLTLTILILVVSSTKATYNTANEVPQGSSLIVKTTYGPVEGFTDSTGGLPYAYFKGIPFASPPVGSLRFKSPQKPQEWTTTLKASNFKPQCLQDEQKPGKVYSEDCLYLNVFEPASEREMLPVLVFIHGGTFLHAGTSDFPSGQLAAYTNSVIVTIPYRLGIFGFYFNKDNADHENVGLLDQAMAIQWVYDNIKNFGGDPSSITLFGESAGGMSVLMQGLMPTVSNFNTPLRAVIAESPAPWILLNTTQASLYGEQIANIVGCTEYSTSCLQSVNGSDLVQAGHPTQKALPYIGGKSLPKQPLAIIESGEYNKIPSIIGTNQYEGNFFIYHSIGAPKILTYEEYVEVTAQGLGRLSDTLDYKTVLQWYTDYTEQVGYWRGLAKIVGDGGVRCGAHFASLKISSYQVNTHWRYLFTRVPKSPASFLNATHTSELPYVFQNPDLFSNATVFNEDDVTVEHAFATLWKSMSALAKPQGTTASWASYGTSQKVLEFNVPLQMIPLDQQYWSYCDNWHHTLISSQ